MASSRLFGRCGKEPLPRSPTPAHVRYAERLRLEILDKIERSTFVLADYFSGSPRVPKIDAPPNSRVTPTQGDVFTEWLKIKRPEIKHSTADQYQQTLDSHHFDTVRCTPTSQFVDFHAEVTRWGVLNAANRTVTFQRNPGAWTAK